MRLKDHSRHPDQYLRHHDVTIKPMTRRGVPLVWLWVQTGGMAASAVLSEDEARKIAGALVTAVEQAKAGSEGSEPAEH